MKKIPKPKVVPISSSKLVKLFPPIKVYTIWQLFKENTNVTRQHDYGTS